MAEEFELVRNANVSLVDEAQAVVGVPFKGVNEIGVIGGEFGGIKKKPNAKQVQRPLVTPYDPARDNVALPDKNPFDATIKLKNDTARATLIPLLNGMSQSEGIRLDSIQREIAQDLAKEEAKPKPDPKVVQQLKDQTTRIEQMKAVNEKGREGIEFPERRV